MTEWLPVLPRLEAVGSTRLALAAVGAASALGLWVAVQGPRDRLGLFARLALSGGLAATVVLLVLSPLEWSQAAWEPGRLPLVAGIPAGLAILGLVLTLLNVDRRAGLAGLLVASTALAVAAVAALAPALRGMGPLTDWGRVAQVTLVAGAAALSLLVGLVLGLRRAAGLLALAIAGVLIWGLNAPTPTGSTGPSPVPLISAAVALTLLLGLVIGLGHAAMINSLQLPPFIATLATLAGLRSLAIILGNNRSITVRYEPFRALGRDNVYTVSIFVAIAVLASLLMGASVLGRHLYALGGNEAAARLSGLPTRRLKSVAYGLSGLLAALGGLLFLGNTGSAQPATTGATYELYAITAAVVGGCSLSGGVGSIRGTVLGLILIQIVIKGTGIVVRGIDSTQIEGLVLGTVVVLAVAFNQRFRVRKN